jgi:L-aspartate semialdehyde sulfurtransferase ferredoxin
MPKKRVVLTFPKNLVGKAIIYNLVKDYNLITNILRAEIMPDEEGKVVLELEGTKDDLENGIKFLKTQDVNLELLGKDIRFEEQKCINCGACVAVCSPKALSLNKKTYKLRFERSKCVLCGLCVNACPVGVIKVEL